MPISAVIVSLVVSIMLGAVWTPIMIRVGHRLNLLDRPSRHKRHKQPVPYLGGTALFITVWGTMAVVLIAFPQLMTELSGLLMYILFGALIIYAIGFLDDKRPLPAWVKLAAEIAAGVVLYSGGLRIDPVSVPFCGQIAVGKLSLVISVLWVVGLTNSINLIDGLDGLASGVSLIGAGTLIAVGNLLNVGVALVFAYCLLGFLAVFLMYNRYPAKIFLGDSGALQIGYYFAVLSLMVPLKSFTAAALYLPLLVLGVPLMETGVSTVRRLWSGKNVMQADRRHLFHYLSAAGLSPHRTVVIFYALSLVFGLFALAMFFWDRILVFTFLVLFMVVIFGAFFIFMTNQSRLKRRSDRR